MLALSACGSDDDERRRRRGGGPETADIRVWINGDGHPAGGPGLAQDDLRGPEPRLDAHHRGAAVGGPGREADHRAVQRVRDPRRGRGRQHPGADVHHGRRVLRPDRRARRPRAATTCCPGFVDGATVDGKTYAVPYYAGLEVRLLPQGPLREGGPRGADHDGRVRRRRDRPQEGQPGAGELLRLLVPRPGLAQRRRVRLERRRRPGRRRRRRRGRARCRAPSRSRASRPCRRSSSEASGAAKDGNEADPWTPFCAGEIGHDVGARAG